MAISVGDKIPSVTLKHMTTDGLADISTDEIFGGKKVVLFSLPGAFTPTCSAKHLPGFVQNAEALKAKGVDTIACVSVNDQNVGDKVLMLADGNAEFSDAVGLSFDGSGFGMGKRAQRYAMVVEDGVVKALNVEQPGAFEVSSAEAMLDAL
jgi:peroxiredoxin